MAISSLLSHHPHTLLPKNPHPKPLSLKHSTLQVRAQLKTSADYKFSWADELSRTHGPSTKKKLEDDAFFQSSVDQRAVDNVRMLVVDSVQHARTGHPGMALGLAEVGDVLDRHAMRYNSKNPYWFNRDRFVLSAGHGCLLQYVCLHLAGFESVQIEDLKQLCKLGSRTPGHPENVATAGVEVTTGPLGQGVANAVGLSLAEAHLAARYNKPDVIVVDHRTYCIMGDGCAMEGISNEAASLAARWKLNKLTLIYDDNHNTIDGDTELTFTEDVSARFKSLGWNTITVENIHEDMGSFHKALQAAHRETTRPTLIKVKTLIGRLSEKEGTSRAHHGTFSDDDVRRMRENIRWEDRHSFHVIPMVYRLYMHQDKKQSKQLNFFHMWNQNQQDLNLHTGAVATEALMYNLKFYKKLRRGKYVRRTWEKTQDLTLQ